MPCSLRIRILKVSSEGYAQLPTSLLQADKSVAAAPPQLAPCAGADLPLLRPLPNVVFRKVVVQRNLRAIQHQQEIVPLLVNPSQGFVQVRKAGPSPKQPVEVPLQRGLASQAQRFPVGQQTLVILPHGIADAVDRFLFPRTQRNQFADGPLGVQPAQRMEQAPNLE